MASYGSPTASSRLPEGAREGAGYEHMLLNVARPAEEPGAQHTEQVERIGNSFYDCLPNSTCSRR